MIARIRIGAALALFVACVPPPAAVAQSAGQAPLSLMPDPSSLPVPPALGGAAAEKAPGKAVRRKTTPQKVKDQPGAPRLMGTTLIEPSAEVGKATGGPKAAPAPAAVEPTPAASPPPEPVPAAAPSTAVASMAMPIEEPYAETEEERDEVAAAVIADGVRSRITLQPKSGDGGNAAGARLPQVAALPGSEVPTLGGRPGVALPGSPDLPILRPTSLRETELPVPGMRSVYAAPEAQLPCLPDGLKQVLQDVADKFGHVAVLNTRRGRGTGARQSYHYQCRAADFRVRGVALRDVMGFLREHPNVGGRKLYPFGFFHIDDGPTRSW